MKMTSIGLIPKDWEIMPLGEVCEFRNGYTPSKAVNSFWENGTIPWFRMEDIREHGRILSDAIQHVTKDAIKGDLFSSNSIIMSTTATIGEHALLIADSLANQRFTNFKIRKSLINKIDVFWFYWYCYKIGDWCRENIHEGGLAAVNIVDLAKLEIPIPTFKEQKRIASALSAIDNLIVALDEAITKKKQIKEGLMQQLLTGKTRLPGFNREWIKKTIEELGTLTGAGVDKLSIKSEKPIRLVNYVDVYHRDFLYNRELHFVVTANNKKIEACNVLKGDVFFTPSSEMPYDIALSAVSMEDMPNVCYSYHVYRLRFKEKVELRFKAYLFKTPSFYKQAGILCEGSGQRYVISMPKFRSMTVAYPNNIEEQKAIADILSAADTEIHSLVAARDKYLFIRQGMMQELLTGKTRLI